MATTKTHSSGSLQNAVVRSRVLEDAREAIYRLRTLRPLLTPGDAETLAILMERELMIHLGKSLQEEASGKMEPLRNILK